MNKSDHIPMKKTPTNDENVDTGSCGRVILVGEGEIIGVLVRELSGLAETSKTPGGVSPKNASAPTNKIFGVGPYWVTRLLMDMIPSSEMDATSGLERRRFKVLAENFPGCNNHSVETQTRGRCNPTCKSMDEVACQLSVGDTVRAEVLGKPSEVGGLGNTVLERNDEGIFLHLPAVLLHSDEWHSRRSEDWCCQQGKSSSDNGEEAHIE